MEKKMDLVQDNIYRLFGRFLLTSVAGMLMISFYILIDTIFIGRGVGSEGLAALNIALPVFNVLLATGLLFGVGGATALSVSLGQRQWKDVNILFTHSVVAAITIGLLYSILGSLWIERLSYFLGASHENIHLVKSYLEVIIFFGFSFVMVNTLTVFIRNDKAPKFAMWTTMISGIVNIVLDGLFIFVFQWGMRGAAIATVSSSLLSLGIVCYYFIFGSTGLRLIRTKLRLDLIKRIIANGIPSCIIEISSGIVIFLINGALLGSTGEIGVAAYGIIANISLICVAIFTGIAQGIQPLISVNYGAGRLDRVNRVKNLGLACSLLFGLVFFLLGQLLPEQIVSLFTRGDRELMVTATVGIRYYFTAFVIMGVNIVMGAYFQSMEDPFPSTILSLGRGVGFTLIGLLALPYLLSIKGIWLVVPFAEMATFILATLFYCKRSGKIHIFS